MNISEVTVEIQKGLWMVVPAMVDKYLKASHQLLSEKPTMMNAKEVQLGRVREIVDPDGNFVRVDQDEIPMDSVGIVRCIGPMYKYGSWYTWGTDELVAMSRMFDDHPNIIGQIWQDDSGGGTIGAVAPYLEFQRNKKKPIVSLVDTCGSASYYKNCGSDHVMAENDISAMMGSIGVMLQFYSYEKLMKDMGIKEHLVYADQSDDKNKAFELALQGKYELIKQEYLNPAAIRFQDHVKDMRPKLDQSVPGILNGKMFYAEEALSYGMIDSIGSMEAAIDRVKFLAGARSFIYS